MEETTPPTKLTNAFLVSAETINNYFKDRGQPISLGETRVLTHNILFALREHGYFLKTKVDNAA